MKNTRVGGQQLSSKEPGQLGDLAHLSLFLLFKIICQSYSSYLSLMLGLICLLFICVYLETCSMKHEISSPRLNLRCSGLGESRYSVLCPNVTSSSFLDLEFLVCKHSWRIIFNTSHVLRAMFRYSKNRRKTSRLHGKVAGKDLSLYLLCALQPIFWPQH